MKFGSSCLQCTDSRLHQGTGVYTVMQFCQRWSGQGKEVLPDWKFWENKRWKCLALGRTGWIWLHPLEWPHVGVCGRHFGHWWGVCSSWRSTSSFWSLDNVFCGVGWCWQASQVLRFWDFWRCQRWWFSCQPAHVRAGDVATLECWWRSWISSLQGCWGSRSWGKPWPKWCQDRSSYGWFFAVVEFPDTTWPCSWSCNNEQAYDKGSCQSHPDRHNVDEIRQGKPWRWSEVYNECSWWLGRPWPAEGEKKWPAFGDLLRHSLFSRFWPQKRPGDRCLPWWSADLLANKPTTFCHPQHGWSWVG